MGNQTSDTFLLMNFRDHWNKRVFVREQTLPSKEAFKKRGNFCFAFFSLGGGCYTDGRGRERKRMKLVPLTLQIKELRLICLLLLEICVYKFLGHSGGSSAIFKK